MGAPVQYVPSFVPMASGVFVALREDVAWVRHGTVPRMEYFVSRVGLPYAYGVKEFARTYLPQPSTAAIDAVWADLERRYGVSFDVCFLNRYLDQSDHLGWHADDSPEMDDRRPIVVLSFGAERQIWFRKKPGTLTDDEIVSGTIEKLTLADGSLLLMPPGMQDTHQHRIPKVGRQCGERISLTFRGYFKEA